MDELVFVLLVVDAALALGVLLVYTLFAPWWSTKTGVGVFALYWTVGLIILHFGAEAVWDQGPAVREVGLLALLGVVLSWNLVLIIYKQVIGRRERRLQRK